MEKPLYILQASRKFEMLLLISVNASGADVRRGLCTNDNYLSLGLFPVSCMFNHFPSPSEVNCLVNYLNFL